jgi:hypothetical protein
LRDDIKINDIYVDGIEDDKNIGLIRSKIKR